MDVRSKKIGVTNQQSVGAQSMAMRNEINDYNGSEYSENYDIGSQHSRDHDSIKNRRYSANEPRQQNKSESRKKSFFGAKQGSFKIKKEKSRFAFNVEVEEEK